MRAGLGVALVASALSPARGPEATALPGRLSPGPWATAERSRPPGPALPAGSVRSFGPGAWCWFQDPRAVQVGGRLGRTYAGWIAQNGDITVGSFDLRSGRRLTHVIGHWIHDDHASPSLMVEPSRRLTVFWAVHNGGSVQYRTTLHPLDIRAWGPVHRLYANLPGNLGITYTAPVSLPAEHDRLYMFWRGPDWGTDYLTRSGDGWGRARELIDQPGQRPYLKVAGNGYDRIALAYNDGHPGETVTSLYFAEYRHGSLWTAGGRWIRRIDSGPMAPSDGDLVYDGRATGVASWVWDVAYDSHQRPVIVYATFPSTGNHAYWYARWDGHRWASRFLTHAGPTISPGGPEVYYSGGLALDHSDPSVVYLSRKAGRWFRLERWQTPDGGAHWRHAVVAARPGDQVRPVVPRGAGGGPISVLWMSGHYGYYIHYDTSISFQVR